MTSVHFFFIALTTGVLLFGAEIFVPGGILGTIAALALIAAGIAGFFAFPGYGPFIAASIVVLSVASVIMWIKIWPHTPIGKKMFIRRNLSDAKASSADLKELLGCEGVADTPLRPAGYALLGDHRVDVVTAGDMIDPGTPVKVVEVEGNRVVVEQLS